jgi:hypothetical protein
MLSTIHLTRGVNMSLIKFILSVPFYIISLVFGFIMEMYREGKKEGLFDEVKPLSVADAMKDARSSAKDLANEIKKA